MEHNFYALVTSTKQNQKGQKQATTMGEKLRNLPQNGKRSHTVRFRKSREGRRDSALGSKEWLCNVQVKQYPFIIDINICQLQ
jgi:hypothetical protein